MATGKAPNGKPYADNRHVEPSQCHGIVSRPLRFAAIATVLCVAALSANAYNLAHRWSFNGDYSDSVGTLIATPTGSPTFNSGMLVLPGGSKGTANVDLGENALSVGSDCITIEIWARQNLALKFARIFDYYNGTGTTEDKENDIYMAWNTGNNSYTTDKVEVKSGGSVKFGSTNTMQPYLQGTMYHISMIFLANANGSTTVSWAKRNTVSGVVEKSYSTTISSWTLTAFHTLAGSPHLHLGCSLYGESDPNADYDEVRIFSGVVGAEQLTANAILGPDAAVTNGADSATGFTIPANATFNFPDGVYSGNAFTVAGAVTFEAGAKIVFDTANTASASMTFSAASYSLPSGVSSVLDMVELTDSTGYEATLSGMTITVAPRNVATWTGAAGDGDWQTAGNWKNGNVPDSGTAVTISGSAVNLNLPVGTTFACASLYIDVCTFTADCDWRGLAVTPTIGSAANLNGHVLTLNNLEANAGASFTNTSATAGEVRFYADGNPAAVTEATFVTGIANLTTAANAKIAIVRTNASSASGTLNIGAAHNHTAFRVGNGTLSLTSAGIVGAASSGAGYLEVTGGTINVNSGGLYIGETGTGMCTQNGGEVNTSAGDVCLGKNSGVSGTYTLDDGNLMPDYWLHVGQNGIGTFTQNGGNVVMNNATIKGGNWLCLAEAAGGNGTYIMNGGYLEVGTSAKGGGIFPGRRGTGRFELNGGTVLTPAFLNQTGHSKVILNGGTIKVSKDSGTGNTDQYSGEYGIFKGIGNLVFGSRATTLDTNGHNTMITNCTYVTSQGGSAFVKCGEGRLTVDVVPPVDTLTVSNGTFAVSANSDNTATAWLAHRWSFNGDYSDSVGTLTATPTGSPMFSNGMLVLPGGSKGTANVDLGANALSVGSDSVTIEIWARQNQALEYARIFDYYNWTGTVEDKKDDIYMAWNTANNSYATDKVEVKSGGSVKFGEVNTMQPYSQGTMYHISMVFHANADGSTTVRWAKRNTASGVVEKSSSNTISNWTLTAFHTLAGSPHLHLGCSLYGESDPKADYDEVRVWSGALSDAALTLSAQKGPNATTTDLAKIAARTLELNSAATLEIASGSTFTQPIVKGNGTVSGGTLKVADSLVTKCGETLFASGTVDLTDAKVVLSDPANLERTGPFSFLKASVGQTLTIVGTPRAIGLPKGWRLRIKGDSADITVSGFNISVK